VGWKALPASDPFDGARDGAAAPERPQLSVVERSGHGGVGFLAQLGMAWTVVLAVLAIGAVIAAAFVWQPMMSMR
jgi:hypothetical protein